jgi:hypothetical protein
MHLGVELDVVVLQWDQVTQLFLELVDLVLEFGFGELFDSVLFC